MPRFIDGTDASEYQRMIAPLIEAAAMGDPGEDGEDLLFLELSERSRKEIHTPSDDAPQAVTSAAAKR